VVSPFQVFQPKFCKHILRKLKYFKNSYEDSQLYEFTGFYFHFLYPRQEEEAGYVDYLYTSNST
jgi:hypothetical protein